MRWATRPGIHVDRAASAWLIKTRVDPDAEFTYVDDLAQVADDTTPFDMFGCDLGHHGDDVTFETILRRYELVDPVLWRIAEIVHEADVADARFDAPEAAGFDLIIRALSSSRSDEEAREVAHVMFDAVERHLRSQLIRRP